MELSTQNSRYCTDTDGHMSSRGAGRVSGYIMSSQYIVSSSTGCSDSQYFEELYSYYTTEKAWHICDPNAEQVFQALKKAGVKVAVVSNFDTRLRPLLRALNCDHWFDALAVSADDLFSFFKCMIMVITDQYRKQVEAEKPNPMMFLRPRQPPSRTNVRGQTLVHLLLPSRLLRPQPLPSTAEARMLQPQ